MKIAIIGAGNMGAAMARGLIQSKSGISEVRVSDINEKNLDSLKQFDSRIIVNKSNIELTKDADIIVLALKPWLIEKICLEIKPEINYEKQILISIAAGISLDQLKGFFSASAKLFRVIPNTAIDVLQSFSSISCSGTSEKEEILILNLFNQLGKSILVPENQLNAFMSLSSCGIAYVFRYIRASTEGAVELGIHPNTAKEVVIQTLRGAIDLLEKTGNHPEIEIDKVTTPGGITIKGLNEMEANGFTNAVIKGLKASHLK